MSKKAALGDLWAGTSTTFHSKSLIEAQLLGCLRSAWDSFLHAFAQTGAVPLSQAFLLLTPSFKAKAALPL